MATPRGLSKRARILDRDPEQGLVVWHDYVPETHQTVITTVQDIQPHRERVAAVRAANEDDKCNIRKRWKQKLRKVASLTAMDQMRMMQKGINPMLWGRCPDTTKKMKQLLNSSDFRPLRTTTEKL